MSTQITFDVTGLIEAIESSDSAYQAALYAEHAEVQIADGDRIGQVPRVLSGRSAIARWIEGIATRGVIHHISNLRVDRTSLSFVDELRDPAGPNVLHRCTAEISTGQITQALVTTEARGHRTGLVLRRRPTTAATSTDDRPHPGPWAWAPPARPADRYLAGNFLG